MDSTKTVSQILLNNWLSPIVIISLLTLLFFIFQYKKGRKATKPHLSDAHLDVRSHNSTLSFKITNHRPHTISLIRIYYRALYLGFIQSFKIRFFHL